MKKVELVTGILEANDLLAKQNRKMFRDKGIYAVNLMSSPGSGKTTLLEKTIAQLKGNLAMGVIEGDIFTSQDAERISNQGVPVVQINTEGGCHLDGSMLTRALEQLPIAGLELLVIENVGNLVCPAEFDLGEDLKVMVLSVAEGNDKPRKYPLMFRESKVIVVNKIDLLPYVDFTMDQLYRDLEELNPEAQIFPLSAKTGEGMAEWLHWLETAVREKVRS